MRNAYRILVVKSDGKRRDKWEDIIRMDLRETECEVGYWMHLAQGRDQWRPLVNILMNLRVPWGGGDFRTS
jgi:hypothetical protein